MPRIGNQNREGLLNKAMLSNALAFKNIDENQRSILLEEFMKWRFVAIRKFDKEFHDKMNSCVLGEDSQYVEWRANQSILEAQVSILKEQISELKQKG